MNMNQKNSNSRVASLGAVSSLAMAIPLLFVAGCFSAKAPTDAPPPPVEEMAGSVAPEALESEEMTVSPEVAIVPEQQFSVVGIAFLEPVQSLREPVPQQGAFVEAEGYGFPAKDAEDAMQKRLTALEAARYRALANLAVKTLGQSVTRDARVVDMAFAGEEIHVTLDGELRGVSEVSRDYDEEKGMATVTLKVALDPREKEGGEQPLSLEQRQARAETAARTQATALLREQVGQVFVEQDVRVENLVMKHQEARAYVQGLLEGIRFSPPIWTSAEKCEVSATLELDRDKLAGLAKGSPDAFPEAGAPAEVK